MTTYYVQGLFARNTYFLSAASLTNLLFGAAKPIYLSPPHAGDDMARHGSLAEQLVALRKYATEPDHDPEPLQTNWSVVPANNNNPDEVADFGHERFLRISPSLEEIMRSVIGHEPERNATGQIIKWGSLRFSDGTQTERCIMYGIDGKAINGEITMPAGAMLRCRDEMEANLGASGKTGKYIDLSNAWFGETLGSLPHRFIKSGKRRKGKNYSRDEAIAMLEEAKANTAVMPAVTVYPTGLPCGMKMVADAFVGMKKGKKGESGSMAWQDFATLKSGREAWRDALRAIPAETRDVLDTSLRAKNMQEIGMSLGFQGKHAERKGKQALIAANDNAADVIELYAA
ncbi:hypothetical protein QWJ46_00610 [Rhizobium sp. CBN3]|uniref:hypothetical protein n=1 Tax=Rhizobium sp. CBN3 TaxID=3058045 RepID=UPI002671782A|nr:hypothetical protein [Rhizobium sp. CBN3]MDO3431175.1 hypothetical protein [Rhizobium sp. CBN3]